MLGDQILHFLEFFYYLLSHFENRWSNSGLTKQWNRWISDFQSGLINSKKIPKNIKFGVQAHFNMENTSNGLDRLFGLQKLTWNFFSVSLGSFCQYIYIYICIYICFRLYFSRNTTNSFFNFWSPKVDLNR